MVDRPGTCRASPSGPGRSGRGGAYGGEAPRGSVASGLEPVEPRREVIQAVDQFVHGGDRRVGPALLELRFAQLGLHAREPLLDRLVRRGPPAQGLVRPLDLLEAARGLLRAAVAVRVVKLAELAVGVED